jgi:TM2 domain-containing membrane protein YozV
MTDVSPKSRLATVLLAWFLGTLGLHRFYIGKVGTGVAILALGLVGWATTWLWGLGFIFITVAGIWVLIDFLITLLGAMKDSEGRPIKNW